MSGDADFERSFQWLGGFRWWLCRLHDDSDFGMQTRGELVNPVALQQYKAACFVQRRCCGCVVVDVSVEIRAGQEEDNRNVGRRSGAAFN